ncbi:MULTISPECIES: DegT/DnrJ/EryC1/StrS family aminotransferase [Clostridium]|jgi:dTDP-4-amino-4,6-dideoxygalactose transaminase|uniref:DegT/DnrJ/EryC1/StrS aminotransferase n=1 Tax=Clostridium saccharoperbutylacetonicum N1-4(HMT) TaxID=931276 RepID=M1MGF4_9CLOT|nr:MULTISPECIES: DegT/DnrJ/EryC1/StrS aminotransferase family protein [Clostridium]AGF55433.1 DegT/DnrJ/EryC1/StrS aminotransferase [Clostridium saccharoperbutylacetonicum N1-4(HMT)]AQR94334.1 UDP-4-amino-4-deoxy-L-arabinose--oxoglutarate aminotransferase [Clostridium saccharoperbutylacetonicum]NRT63853.1 dTDP-4-amino-4,6-dideoxygalactose transaminase [Clostridium saccharoperbutylacetonicum]NSB27216.1 dTDP-4-amino-4,6-dideoxygalactose transaminase [Clostridium saccharoperbutylacetonicum]NSB300
MKKIPFSPPDITEEEIEAVANVLRSGWITSGPKLAEFEEGIEKYCKVNKALALNSATAAEELVLKVFDFKEGDEIITTPYTYTATSSAAIHRGVKPIYVDVKKDTFMLDIDKVAEKITDKTRAIIPVDIAGVPFDYDALKKVLKDLNREDIMIICDSAHSFGAKYKGEPVGSQAHFHSFSFHAVKNLTTGEGGAVTFNDNHFGDHEDLLKYMRYTAMHGQTKDALSKLKAGAWEYDIINDGMKCNLTDIGAAIGVVQLKRYDAMLEKRRQIFKVYTDILGKEDFSIIPFTKDDKGTETSYHLYLYRVKGFNEEKRNAAIEKLAQMGIATNVHYKPLPMLTLYKNLGYDIKDYPNAYAQYENEISLPVYTILSLEDAEYIAKEVVKVIKELL